MTVETGMLLATEEKLRSMKHLILDTYMVSKTESHFFQIMLYFVL